MQAIFEIIFDLVYLITVITMGVIMMVKSRGRNQIKLFGIMAVVLGVGDAFHLVPRVFALSTDGLASHYEILGFGTFVASITMTIFYVILYRIAQQRYDLKTKWITFLVYLLAAARIFLCFVPANKWLSPTPSVAWGIYRNIPFLMLGILIIILFYRETKRTTDPALNRMWLAILLSFGFYIPVVVWADQIPALGVLMIPKTLAYVWMVVMGWNAMKTDPLEKKQQKT